MTQRATKPPSTGSATPVVPDNAGVPRKQIPLAAPSGVFMRPIGWTDFKSAGTRSRSDSAMYSVGCNGIQ